MRMSYSLRSVNTIIDIWPRALVYLQTELGIALRKYVFFFSIVVLHRQAWLEHLEVYFMGIQCKF